MADNLTTPLAPGVPIAADDVSGVMYPRTKISFGEDGSASDVTENNGLPVSSEDLATIAMSLRSMALLFGTLSPDNFGRLRVTAAEISQPVTGTVAVSSIAGAGTFATTTTAIATSYDQYGAMMQGAAMIRGNII